MNDHLARAQAALEIGRPQVAEAEARRHLVDEPESVAGLLTLTRALATQSKHEEAIAMARSTIVAAPDLSAGHLMLGACLIDRNGRGDAKAAVAALQESIRLDPQEPAAHALLGRAWVLLNKPKQALAAVDAALMLSPRDTDALNMRAHILLALRRKAEARVANAMALSSGPEEAAGHGIRGALLYDADRYHEAADAFRECLRLDPGNEGACIGLVDSVRRQSGWYRTLAAPLAFLGSMPFVIRIVVIVVLLQTGLFVLWLVCLVAFLSAKWAVEARMRRDPMLREAMAVAKRSK